MDFSIYIDPELLMLIPVLNLAGFFIKNTGKPDSRYIPVILCAISVLLCVLKAAGSAGNAFEMIYTGVTQGIMIAASAVFSNQVYKQTKMKGGADDDRNDSES